MPQVRWPLLLLVSTGCSLPLAGLGEATTPDAAGNDDGSAPDARGGPDATTGPSEAGGTDAPANDAPAPDAASADGPAEASGPPPPPNPMTGWKRRRPLTIDNAAYGALTDFAVLAKLDATRIDYAATQKAGQDLRFVDAAGNLLPYEIESFGAPVSWVWFAVGSIAAHTKTVVWMYYGNPGAADAQQPTGVWDSSFVGVWHLKDAHDSTGAHASINNGAMPAQGVVGPAMHFDGKTQNIDTASGEQLATWTVEVWSSADAAPNQSGWYGPMMHDEDWGIGWDCNPQFWPASAQSISVLIPGSPGCNQGWCTAAFAGAGTPSALKTATWYDLAATFDGQTLAAYTDGALHDGHAQPGTPATAQRTAKIGSSEYGAPFFAGTVDEARVSSVARTADWIGAQHASMTDAYVTYGPEQMNP